MHVHLPATNIFSQNRFASITEDYKKFICIIYSLAAGSGFEAFNLYSNLLSSCIIQRKSERKYVSRNNPRSTVFVHLWIFSFVINSLKMGTSSHQIIPAQTLIKAAFLNNKWGIHCHTNLFYCHTRRWIQYIFETENLREKVVFSLAFFSTAVYHSCKLVFKHTKKMSVRSRSAAHKTAHNCSSSLPNFKPCKTC